MRFLVEAGSHREDGVTYKKGEIVTTQSNLVVMFGEDIFKALDSKDDDEVEEEEDEDDLSFDEIKMGKNVTDDFPLAETLGLLVFKKGAYYRVSDVDDPNMKLNEKGLKKDAVNTFLEEYEG